MPSRPSFAAALVGIQIWPVVAAVLASALVVLAALSVRARRTRSFDAFRMSLELSPDAVLAVDHDGRIAFANERVTDVFGHDPTDLIGQSVEVLVPEMTAARHRDLRDRYLSHPVARAMGEGRDLVGRRADGSPVAVDVSLAPVSLAGQQLVVASCRDASLRQAVASDRALMTALVATSSDAIFTVAQDGRIRTWNIGAMEVLGYAPDEAVGQIVGMLDEPNRASSVLTDAVNDLLIAGGSARRSAALRRADGAAVDVIMALSAIEVPGVGPTVAVIARDITAEKAADEALAVAFDRERQAAEQLRTTDRLKDEFLDLTAHELRTPLTAIMGFADLLVEGVEPSLVHEFQVRILENAVSMREMVDRLLDFSRLRAGRVHVRTRPLPLREIVVATRDRLLQTRRDRAVLIDVPADMMVMADLDALDQVIANLVDNALKFSTPAAPVRITAEALADEVVIRVVDGGSGIPAEDLPHVFERFYQSNATHPVGVRGAGVGLSIAQRYVELQGGRIWVDATSTEGTAVAVSLRRPGSRGRAAETEPASPTDATREEHR